MEVGDIRGMLAIARKARGITQKELAERCGLAEVTIRQYEIVVIPERKLGGE